VSEPVGQVQFHVLGPPRPAARPRVVRGVAKCDPSGRGRSHAYIPEATRRYQQAVAAAGLVARAKFEKFQGKRWDLGRYFAVRLDVVGAAGDADNFAKGCLDALTKILWNDDRQVRVLGVRLIESKEPETRIEVLSFQTNEVEQWSLR
jgi:Holliday junction resolvase RusA-like endonuclease